MKRSDNLFQLIKSMTKGEKRNFKLLSGMNSGDKKYMQLFDMLEGMDEYDEEEVLAEFEGNSFMNQPAAARYYLYHLILRSFSYFDSSDFSDVCEQCKQIRFLIEKRMYDAARRLITSTYKIAEKREYFNLQIQLQEFEREILLRSPRVSRKQRKLWEVEDRISRVMLKIQNLQAYRILFDDVLSLTEEVADVRSEREKALVDELYSHSLMQSEAAAESMRARLLYLQLHRIRAKFIDDTDLLITFSSRFLDLLDQQMFPGEYETEYLTELNELYLAYYRNSDIGNLLACHDRNRTFKPQSEHAVSEARVQEYTNSLITFIHLGDVKGGHKLIEKFRNSELNLENVSRQDYLEMIYLFAYFYFTAGDYKEALKWINNLLNDEEKSLRTNLRCFARILNLAIHYELRNYEHIRYLHKSTYRFVYVNKRMYEFEKSILRMYSKLSRNDESQHDRIMRESRNILNNLGSSGFEEQAVKWLDMATYLDARIRNTDMPILLKKKFWKNVQVPEENAAESGG